MTFSPRSIAVFDAGIGSYAIVDLIRSRARAQKIVYLADRASFPYGSKTKAEMLSTMKKTVGFLETYDPDAIVLASNAPSIMVLDELRSYSKIPIFGVEPPLRQAIQQSTSKHVAILGVKSLIESSELRSFVDRNADEAKSVRLVNASPLVDLVENGKFLFSPKETQDIVNRFMLDQDAINPDTDAFTLSSTHLPWLKSFFERSLPNANFLDPAEAIVAKLPLNKSDEDGHTRCLVTESTEHKAVDFQRMLDCLRISLPIEIVKID